ncbi:MAG: DNA polymerase III subunit gamma/tau [Mojavia pulchra JT2-VF2]|jgi:DNA polymerase-3 subunit gamma/tau|uniref:DNA polymerase III subunit gamma/tau n=1 Tax=Mojavia pulchra JT2-VF2 TaxID=287848 RepID=A0A951Q146_9NOST|nr:DNA polymerase III subunit gamma/tau [Mojavia pulchra JT2-VF2]
MSYEPLHHKYRPKSFAELVGQEAIATTLTNAIRSSKIAPAYLFTGPRGTGKTSSARILAKSLNCLQSNQPTAEPCGVCDVCQGITKGYSLDVIEIDAASNTGVDNIREIIEKAQFAPVQCRYKVYVIDECHMLSNQAFNALLKTLEEPPKHVVFVLATTDPQRVLPTIISRCQRFDFRRIQLEAMVKHLSVIASKENINISPEAVTLVGQIAQGGLRDAESLLDQLALLAGEVTPEKVWDLVGSVSERDLLALLGAIAQNHPEAVLDSTRAILDRGREPLTILQNLAAFYRDLLIAKTAPNRQDLVACTQQTWKALVECAQQLEISTILVGQKHLREAELQIKNTTQPRLWLEVTFLGLLPSANVQPQASTISPRVNTAAVSPSYSPAVAQNHQVSAPPPVDSQTNQSPPAVTQNHQVSYPPTNHNLAANSVSPPTPEPVSIPAPPAIIEPVTSEAVEEAHYDLTQVWQQVCANFPPSRQALLGQMCQLIEFNGAVARVAVRGAKWYEKLKSDLPMMKAAFQQTFQREVQVNLEQVTSATPTSARRNPSPQDSARVQQPATSKYERQIPSPAPQPTPAPGKIEPVATNTGMVQTLPPPQQPQTPVPDSQTDEVADAAQCLAKFFDGQIIRFLDNAIDLSENVTLPESVYESDDDDD